MPFQAGWDKGATFTITGGAEGALCITGHSWEETVDKLDVSSTCTGQGQALIAGVFRGDGTVKANLNTSLHPNVVASVAAGVKGILKLRVGSTGVFLQIPCMITKLRWASEHAGLVTYEFDVSLDLLSGSYIRPFGE